MQKHKRIEQYQLMQIIGKGANGLVYKGLNTADGSLVAIKELFIGKSEVKAIKTELELLKQLEHPSIVRFIDAIQKQNRIYLILEYMEGGSLGVLVRKNPLEEDVAKIYIKQVLTGLIFLHKKEVIHRDIKGANILLTKNGLIKLADFGVAVKLQDNQKTISAAGSPYWMAPQNISSGGEQPSVKCDIWSLGCTLIELLTGNPPYYDLMQFPALFRIVEDDHPPLPDCSSQCKQFLLACFIKDPKKRPSAQQLFSHPWLRNANDLKPLASEHETQTVQQLEQALKPPINYSELLKLLATTKKAKLLYKNKYFYGVVQDNRGSGCQRLRLAVALVQAEEDSLEYLYRTGVIGQEFQKFMGKIEIAEDLYRGFCQLVLAIFGIYFRAVNQGQITGQGFSSTSVSLLSIIIMQICIPSLQKLLTVLPRQSFSPSKLHLLSALSSYLSTLKSIDLDEEIELKLQILHELQEKGTLKYILNLNETKREESLSQAKTEILGKLVCCFHFLMEIKTGFRKYFVYAIGQLMKNGLVEASQTLFLCIQELATTQIGKAELQKSGLIPCLSLYYAKSMENSPEGMPELYQSLLILDQFLHTSKGGVDRNRILQFHRHKGLVSLMKILQHLKAQQKKNKKFTSSATVQKLASLISILQNYGG